MGSFAINTDSLAPLHTSTQPPLVTQIGELCLTAPSVRGLAFGFLPRMILTAAVIAMTEEVRVVTARASGIKGCLYPKHS